MRSGSPAALFVYIFVFGHFEGVLVIFSTFLVPIESWDKNLQSIKIVGWNVFLSHFMAKTVFQKSERSAIFGLCPF